jgi:gliding motility-associated-like protein
LDFTIVAQLNSTTGQFLWGLRGGGDASDLSADLALGGPGNAPHITGYTGYTVYSTPAAATFGAFTLPFNPSGYTGFIARLSPPAPTVQLLGDSLLCQGGQVVLRASTAAAVRAYLWSTGATTPTLAVGQPGTYTVMVTFSTGQTATASFRVAALPTTLAIGGDTLLCPGGSGQLRALSPAAGATYQWSTGAQTPGIAVTQAGLYTLTASYGSGCTLTARIRVRMAAVHITGRPQLCPDQSGPTYLTAVAPGALAYRWSTGAATAQVIVAQAGLYSVTATFANGCTLTATQVVSAPEASIQGDSLLCPGRPAQLTAANPAALAYAWSTGAITPTILAGQAGTYSVVVSFGSGCSATARYQVRAAPANPPLTLGPDTTICEGAQLVLSARLPAGSHAVQYQWSDGSTGPELVAQQPGVYRVQRTTRCETQTAIRQISTRSCLLIPNIITPNNDGQNDLFVIQGLPPGAWRLAIFNRWGQPVYQTEAYHADWGTLAAPGLYYYVLQQAATGRSHKGWVEVVR